MIKIFAFHKEENILEEWILYHSYLFGIKNIHNIDHGSSEKYIKILEKYRLQGLNVKYFNGSFSTKSYELSKWMREYRMRNWFLIPLDIDEFIVKSCNKSFSVDRDKIINCFNDLPNDIRCKFGEIKALCHKFNYTDPLIEQNKFEIKKAKDIGVRAKTFFPSHLFELTDQGNHFGKIKTEWKDLTGEDEIIKYMEKYGNALYNEKEFFYTDLSLLHFEIRGYSHLESKAIKGAKAYGYDKNYDKIKNGGLIWRKYYSHYLDNKLEQYYRDDIMNDSGELINEFSSFIEKIRL